MSVGLKWSMALAIAAVTTLVSTHTSYAETFEIRHSFCAESHCLDGVQPLAGLVQATNGHFYGATAGGSEDGYSQQYFGTIFKISRGGTLTTLYSFCSEAACKDGIGPRGLIQAPDGNFYGMTNGGGANGNYGTVFKITTAGTLTTLYSFCAKTYCPDGEYPSSSLIRGSDGNFYGTTAAGGANAKDNAVYYGTVFKITAAGKLTTLHSFCSEADCADGREAVSGLVEGSNGNFYGTTVSGGPLAGGTVFEITPSGVLTTLYTFCSQPGCTDGLLPWAGLIKAKDGNFYGTTFAGGTNDDGTIFKLTESGTLTTVYNFCSKAACEDGDGPYAGLIQASDGNLYGTTSGRGNNGFGTIFKLTPSGALTTLYSFCSQADCPNVGDTAAGLLQATNGIFYGTSPEGGYDTVCNDGGCGTIFSLAVGLAPFVETQSTSGKVGAAVTILGTDLTGATRVTFNGTVATFTVASASAITTKVPTGATTGSVEVVTPGGTLKSNAVYTVTP